jgi:PLAT/LH2 domain-containing protein
MSHRQAIRFATLTAATIFASSAHHGPDESMGIVRAQLELSVCELPSAGTEDPVSAGLKGGGSVQLTWLDHPGRDFERGSRYAYDLSLDDTRTLADVAELEVSKTGNDDLCLRELRLIVNQKTIFIRTFSEGRWLSQRTGNRIRITRAELRANSAWQGYSWSLSEWIAATSGAVAPAEVVERLQSCIATAMHDLGLGWKDGALQPLTLRRHDDSSLSARVELVHPVAYWMDTDVVLELDLGLCRGGHAAPSITRVALHDAPRWYAVASGRSPSADDQRMLTALTARLTQARPLVMADGICPHVDANMKVTY